MTEEIFAIITTEFSTFSSYRANSKSKVEILKSDLQGTPSRGRNDDERKAYRMAIKTFHQFLKKEKLAAYRLLPFIIHIQRQIGWVDLFERSFQFSTPSVVVTEYDRYNEITALIIAANQNKIPTITLTHGLLNFRFAYAPLVANDILCWGEAQREMLLNWGVSQHRIHITGAVQLRDTRNEKGVLKGLPEYKPGNHKVLLLATNPIEAVRQDLISFFTEVINCLSDDWIGLIRLHPSESSQDYLPYLVSERTTILESDKVSYDESMATADVVGVFNSAFAIDSMMVGIPTVQFDITKQFEGAVKDMVQRNLLKAFSNPKQCAEYVEALMTDGKTKDEWKSQNKRFRKDYCVACGREAARNVVCEINKILKNKSHIEFDESVPVDL
ncbi:MAG: hypothetical protein H6608_01900 [Flavobacteriales bacterium]|nr:hypothetical protein [Flavobacteriales bacterium]